MNTLSIKERVEKGKLPERLRTRPNIKQELEDLNDLFRKDKLQREADNK